MRPALVVALMFGLAACAPVQRAAAPQGAQSPAGPEARFDVGRADSQVSIAGDDSIVLRRQVRRLPDRYDEVLTLEDGMIEYQKFAAPRTGEDADGRAIIRRLLATDTYRQLGLPQQPESYRASRNRNGEFDYALLDGDDLRCVLMSQFFGGSANAGRNQELRVALCRENDAPRAEALEADAMALIGRINLDGGAGNRARSAAAIDNNKN